jgi:hypothetical protein
MVCRINGPRAFSTERPLYLQRQPMVRNYLDGLPPAITTKKSTVIISQLKRLIFQIDAEAAIVIAALQCRYWPRRQKCSARRHSMAAVVTAPDSANKKGAGATPALQPNAVNHSAALDDQTAGAAAV